MTEIQRIVDSIPEPEFLGVLTTEIEPYSGVKCLVCRLVSPDEPYKWGIGAPFRAKWGIDTPFCAAATALGLSRNDMCYLYIAAAKCTADVEEAIADRLNRLVTV